MAAANLVNIVSASLAMADLTQAKVWREEDIKQRIFENTRRDIDEKQEQLRSLSNLAALLAGFDVIILIELDVPHNVPQGLLVALGITSALTVCCMVLSFMLNSLVLVGILKAYDVNKPPKQSFQEFWDLRCEEDFKLGFWYFTVGVPLFMINLVIASWVKFLSQKIMCTVITFIVFIALFLWHRMYKKWGSFLISEEEPCQNNPVHGSITASANGEVPVVLSDVENQTLNI